MPYPQYNNICATFIMVARYIAVRTKFDDQFSLVRHALYGAVCFRKMRQSF